MEWSNLKKSKGVEDKGFQDRKNEFFKKLREKREAEEKSKAKQKSKASTKTKPKVKVVAILKKTKQ